MIVPIVEPTRPNTSSILGSKRPTIKETPTKKTVNHLNLPSGICVGPPAKSGCHDET